MTLQVVADPESGGAGTPEAAAAAFLIIYLIIFLIFCIIAILIAVWIYKDAKKHNIENEAMWAIIGLLLGIIGLIIYILVNSDKRK